MLYEVYTITGGAGEHTKYASKVAEEIKEVYVRIAELGGKIIAQHTLTAANQYEKDSVCLNSNTLFLVSELPEPQPSE